MSPSATLVVVAAASAVSVSHGSGTICTNETASGM